MYLSTKPATLMFKNFKLLFHGLHDCMYKPSTSNEVSIHSVCEAKLKFNITSCKEDPKIWLCVARMHIMINNAWQVFR